VGSREILVSNARWQVNLSIHKIMLYLWREVLVGKKGGNKRNRTWIN